MGENEGLLLGAGVIAGGGTSYVTFINLSTQYKTLKAGHCCASAVEIDDLWVDSDETDMDVDNVETLPIPDQSTESIARIFYDQFVTVFGLPVQIHTDQGKSFDGNYFKALCALLQIAKSRTTPYHPSSNGQVETYNRVVLRFLRCFLEGKQRDWDKYVSSVGMSLRA